MAGWDAYSNLGIQAGATKVAIFGTDGVKWAGNIDAIRNCAVLVADTQAKKPSGELHFDGKKFMAMGEVEGVMVGKGGDEGVGVILSAKTIIIAVCNGPPQAVIAPILAVHNAIKTAGY